MKRLIIPGILLVLVVVAIVIARRSNKAAQEAAAQVAESREKWEALNSTLEQLKARTHGAGSPNPPTGQ